MKEKYIKVIKDFNESPYGRYKTDGPGCELTSGETFRQDYLAPALRAFDKVHVDLTGYNRYGRSFLDEAFGGLIREEGFSGDDLESKLTYEHALVGRIEDVIKERILAAIRDCE